MPRANPNAGGNHRKSIVQSLGGRLKMLELSALHSSADIYS